MDAIVVGFDGTRSATAALVWAAGEAARHRGELVVVYVHEHRPPRAPYAPFRETPNVTATGDRIEKAVAGLLARLPSVPYRYLRDTGRPAAVLVRHAGDARLLAIGRGGGAAYLGPTARACLIAAACPVVTVADAGPPVEMT